MSNLEKELAALRVERDEWKRRAEAAAHVKADDKVGFDWKLLEELDALKAENKELTNKLFKVAKALRQTAEHYHGATRAKTLLEERHTSQDFDTCTNGWCMEAAEPLKVTK